LGLLKQRKAVSKKLLAKHERTPSGKPAKSEQETVNVKLVTDGGSLVGAGQVIELAIS
jgi:hypothetical protein